MMFKFKLMFNFIGLWLGIFLLLNGLTFSFLSGVSLHSTSLVFLGAAITGWVISKMRQ